MAAGLVLAAVAAGGPALAAATPTARPGTSSRSTAARATLPVEVRPVSVQPAAYVPAGAAPAGAQPTGSTVTVRGTVRNTGTEPVEDVTVHLRVQRAALRTREAVDDWADAAPTAALGGGFRSVAQVPAGSLPGGSRREPAVLVPGTLAPGEEAPFTLTADAADLGTAPGAHATAVEVRSGTRRAGIARTYLTAAPATTVQGTRISLLTPLVAPRPLDRAEPADGLADAADLAAQVRGGALGNTLAATADRRVSWVLDPALLRSAQAAAQEGADGPDGRAAADWLAAVRAGATGRDVLALPWADPDLAALARAGDGAALLEAAGRAGSEAAELLGEPVLDDVAWPAGGAADARTAAFAAAGGARAVVLDRASAPVEADLTYTPTGRSDVRTREGTLDALVADAELSAALAGTAQEDSGTLAVQRFLAEAATVTLERPNDTRSLLAVAPRGWNPSPAAVTALLAALDASPWAEVQPLSDLLATEAPGGAHGPPGEKVEDPTRRLPGAHLQALATTRRRLDGLAAALQGPAPQVQDRQRAALALASVAWRGRGEDLVESRTRLDAAVRDLLAAVRIAPGSDRNLAATHAELPLTVVNELPVPVTVELTMRPRTARLRLADRSRTLTLQPRSQQRVGVPVEAVANGRVVVDAELRTPDGTALGARAPITVNISMGLETWILGGVAGGAGLLLAVGLVRAVRRGHRRMDEVEVVVPADGAGTDDAGTPGAADGAGAQGPVRTS
ncbi:DUF6049 family protein [Kineococcus sp. NUM-3379]